MVKQEGGKVRSAYLMADLPEGASVPYMPMAHSREHIPPALGDVDHMDTLSRELMPADTCLLYTSDAADDMQCVDLGGRRII